MEMGLLTGTPEALERLGIFVAGRRRYMRLTQEEVREKGGPSNATLTAIEGGKPRGKGITGATLRKLDTALMLAPGTCQRVFNGDEVPVDATSFTGKEQSLDLSRDQIEELLGQVDTEELAGEVFRRLTKFEASHEHLKRLQEALREGVPASVSDGWL